jgi:pimeloyl-ACP methyl ester carboxylesterase
MLEDARGRIDYDEEGVGPTILFVPGSWGTRSAWRSVIAALDGPFCMITTSLLGYGGTEERRTAANASIEQEAEVLEAIVRRAGGSVHLVGHSYGALVCLAVAIRGIATLASLIVIEPVALDLLRRAGDLALYQQFTTMRDGYFRAFENGDKEAARRAIDFLGGGGSFDALPPRMRDYIVATTATHILDMRSDLDAPISVYSGISVPSLIIRGDRTHPSLGRSAEILSSAMPNASLVTVPAAGHFVMTTHAEDVAKLIGDHVLKVRTLM